jgi:hypothetical protein
VVDWGIGGPLLGGIVVRITFHKRWLLSGLAGLAMGVATANAQGPAPIFTKNGSLRLPIQLDDRTKSEIAEIGNACKLRRRPRQPSTIAPRAMASIDSPS